MSTMQDHSDNHKDCKEKPCSGIDLLIKPFQKDLGGFFIKRLLPFSKRDMVGPWIFFDHAGPVDFPAGKGIDVRPHPHINLATVTYVFEGEILHRDSLGTVQAIRPGDLNLMVAGKGIVHSERETEEVRNRPHRLHLLQLWHALPEADEETDPSFHHYPAKDLPGKRVNDISVRVMMGTGWGLTSPVKTFAQTFYADADMQAGDRLPLPKGVDELAVYLVNGSVSYHDYAVPLHHMAVFDDASRDGELIATADDTRIVLIGGAKMPYRYKFWNFVSSSKDRLKKAADDWRENRFGVTVPGDEEDFIPLPENLKFR